MCLILTSGFLYFLLLCNRALESSSQECIAARTDAVVTILVSTEGYVRRLVTLAAHGLSAPAPTITQAVDVTRLNIQERVKTSLKTALRRLESTSFLILRTKRFPFSMTWNRNQDLFRRWYKKLNVRCDWTVQNERSIFVLLSRSRIRIIQMKVILLLTSRQSPAR